MSDTNQPHRTSNASATLGPAPPPPAKLAERSMSPPARGNSNGAHGQLIDHGYEHGNDHWNELEQGAEPSDMPPSSPSTSTSPLLTRLNRLSMSTSRPNLPPQEGYASRTFRTVSSSVSSVSHSLHSLTGSMWTDASGSTVGGQPGTFDERSAQAGGWDGGKIGSGSDASSQPPVPPGMMRRASAPLDTSSILYPTLENHPAPLAHPLLVLDLAALTSVPTSISNEQLLATLLGRLEPWVGEENEGSGYCLIVLAAEDPFEKAKVRALPGVAWWLWHWRRIPRKYRKNLKRLYIVHPSTMTRTVLPILIPLVSPKSYAKLHTVPSLLGLARRGISLAGINVPLVTLNEEARVIREHPNAANGHTATNIAVHSAPSGWWGSMASFLPWGHSNDPGAVPAQPQPHQQSVVAPISTEPTVPYWSQDIDVLVEMNGGHLPRALKDLGVAILEYCTTTEGVFRRSPNTTLSSPIRAFLDLPLSRQPRIDWVSVATFDPLLPPILYKRLIAQLPAPIVSAGLYPAIRKSFTPEEIKTHILAHLSPARAAVLDNTVHLAHHLLAHEPMTRMGVRALSIVIAPCLIAGDPREDAFLCMEPGRMLPALLGMASLNAAMADSDSDADVDTDASEIGSVRDVKQDAKPKQKSAPPVPPPRQNTLVGVLEAYISHYPAFHGSSSPTCDCGFPETGMHTPISRAPSPRKGHWVLSGAGLAPPVET